MVMAHNGLHHIVLVEDNEASRHLMREAFKTAPFEAKLHITENGTQLFHFLRQEKNFSSAPRPDLIILDLNLPGKSGVELMAEIKGDERFKTIPLIVLTGSNASRDIESCIQYGCKYLLKPSRFHELVKLVGSLPSFC